VAVQDGGIGKAPWEGRAMILRGIVQSATLEENPPGSETIEMVLQVQGVGPGQPRRIVVPFSLLLADPGLEPETVAGHGFEAEVENAGGSRWVVRQIGFAARRVLRDEEEQE
jgi:hypothetical protein